eukprot:COSAG01_NODE_68186_length_264_cov_117.690909_1_plen_84_part_10
MVDGQLRVRGTQGWTSLTKKATGEPLLRGYVAGSVADVSVLSAQVQGTPFHGSVASTDAGTGSLPPVTPRQPDSLGAAGQEIMT